MAGPGYKLIPPPRTDQIEDQLILNIVARNKSSLDGSYYLYLSGMFVEDGVIYEIDRATSAKSPAALGKAIETLIDKMK